MQVGGKYDPPGGWLPRQPVAALHVLLTRCNAQTAHCITLPCQRVQVCGEQRPRCIWARGRGRPGPPASTCRQPADARVPRTPPLPDGVAYVQASAAAHMRHAMIAHTCAYPSLRPPAAHAYAPVPVPSPPRSRPCWACGGLARLPPAPSPLCAAYMSTSCSITCRPMQMAFTIACTLLVCPLLTGTTTSVCVPYTPAGPGGLACCRGAQAGRGRRAAGGAAQGGRRNAPYRAGDQLQHCVSLNANALSYCRALHVNQPLLAAASWITRSGLVGLAGGGVPHRRRPPRAPLGHLPAPRLLRRVEPGRRDVRLRLPRVDL